ncbi:MAG: septation ring formation regulator EzrA [Bacilli bacterium]|nr:septation ring formation regulator EzrA [Bacilli bacterium]
MAEEQAKLIVILTSIGGGLILFVALFIVLYILVFSKKKFKRQIRDIERKYSYLDALLMGQDSQYIHRLEIISHSNLLYVDKHETFQRRFKEIYDNDDKYAESLIRQLHNLVANNQYRNIKATINDAKKAVNILEDSVNTLNDDLYALIKLEEDSRQTILKLKEDYRLVKQIYYINSNDLELVAGSVNKVFNKLDTIFTEYDEHIEKAEYDEANALVPTIQSVINALHKIFEELPNLCSLVIQVVPSKIEGLNTKYLQLSRQSLPLMHLSIPDYIRQFRQLNSSIRDGIVDLKIIGLTAKCEEMIKDIEGLEAALDKEVEDRDYFNAALDPLYQKVKALDDVFLRIMNLLPEVRSVYTVGEEQEERINDLKKNIDKLWATKRGLDGFIHSGTKQPYSVLREKLNDLANDYEIANTALKDFKAYLDSLKVSCEEAYSMVNVYYYRTKQVEYTLRLIALDDITNKYKENIDTTYQILCDIDTTLRAKPIDVNRINVLAENLKDTANRLFDEVEELYRDSCLAESAIVYANRDRNHQSDVNQQLSILEQNFYQGAFEKVYEDANSIYRRAHVEESGRGRR